MRAKGQYLKPILIYRGYETYDSVMKLKGDAEMSDVLSFIKEASNIMDEKEKEEMFGILSKQDPYRNFEQKFPEFSLRGQPKFPEFGHLIIFAIRDYP